MQANPLQGMSGANGIVTGIFVIGSLYFARELLIPLALAVLISFVLTPLVIGLRRTGVPRSASVLIVVTVSFTIILTAGVIGASQIVQLADSLPKYQSNLEEKVRTLSGTVLSSEALSHAADMIGSLGKELASEEPNADASRPAPADRPIPVEIRAPSPDALQVLSNFILPIVSPLVTAALVIIFVIFFLLQREELRDRVIRMLGTRTLHRTTEAMGKAAARLSHYLFLFTMLNAAYGAAVGVALWFIGIPSPWLWGIFAMLMRYVPFVGSFLAAIFPVALAAAVDPGWTMVLWTVVIYGVGEPLMGNFVEPFVLGQRTGLSPVAILIAATFWTWLWGPIGLILATPLTLCLVVLGQYVRPLEFLHVMLGDQPPLTPPEMVYQRLIAGDPDEVLDQAEQQLKEISLVNYFDQVVLPGLELADRDVRSGELSSDRQLLLVDGIRDLTSSLVEQDATVGNSLGQGLSGSSQVPTVPPEARSQLRAEWQVETPILCIGAGGTVNHAAAALLVHVLNDIGLGSILPSAHGFAGLSEIAGKSREIRLVCVCMVGAARVAHARFLVRRVRRAFPNAKIMIGFWCAPTDMSTLTQVKAESGVDFFSTTLSEAVDLCVGEACGEGLSAHKGQAQQSVTAQDEDAKASAKPGVVLSA